MPRQPDTGSSSDAERRAWLRMSLVVVLAFAAAIVLSQADLVLYHHYGLNLLHGRTSHRLPVEYPALSAAIFAAPLALPLPYKVGFALLMLAAFAGLALVGRRLGAEPGWRDRLVWYLGLGTIAVLFARYDLVPAVAVLIAVLEARRQHWGTAWLACLVGAALKIFPLLLLPGFLIFEWREKRRIPWGRLLLAGVVIAAAGLLQNSLVPGSFLSPLHYELNRGFEFSSFPGTLTALADPFHLHFLYSFKSWEVFGVGHTAIKYAVEIAEVGALGTLWMLAWRGRLSADELSLAALTVVVFADRAFAPQYLIWLAPLWALWPLRRSWLAASALTTLAFPVIFTFHLRVGLVPSTLTGAARNLVLLAGTLVWLNERLNSRTKSAVVSLNKVRSIGLNGSINLPRGTRGDESEVKTLVTGLSSNLEEPPVLNRPVERGGTSVIDEH